MRRLKQRNVQPNIAILVLLLIATIGCLSLAVYLREYTNRQLYLYLNWDVFLAWVPVGLTLLMNIVYVYMNKNRTFRWISLLLIGLAWLFFYPNSAYLITDMLHPFVHYKPEAGERFTQDLEFWYHLILFFSAALIGLLLSIVSLFSVHGLVRRTFGEITGWIFALIILMLSSLGIYIGRFVRWNSWDVLLKPSKIFQDTLLLLTDPEQLQHVLPFTGMIFAVTLISYCVVYCFSYMKR
ncbi:DUF1361 domain-containing protein [Paenibacillus macquariensis]|uniref:Uncharacterized membrane protein n=1 Tax=Paenibacillus macquariensis TaxID=948756 RepID=A0ABY1KBI4_9BACL|nr:DUF1361 domain-containing protein [Paenibacillus macquariensis]MEC0094276.1 DUF1361 domain-containing protein [Paenibacillus macquariensis]OAB32167.1 hypothetical protein PMSM_18085 [Paenibacillus macquariensis subsp. macquariensis]SIR55554.1 Uncharacterized membrane protein [Paenibacillus macquariensis]